MEAPSCDHECQHSAEGRRVDPCWSPHCTKFSCHLCTLKFFSSLPEPEQKEGSFWSEQNSFRLCRSHADRFSPKESYAPPEKASISPVMVPIEEAIDLISSCSDLSESPYEPDSSETPFAHPPKALPPEVRAPALHLISSPIRKILALCPPPGGTTAVAIIDVVDVTTKSRLLFPPP